MTTKIAQAQEGRMKHKFLPARPYAIEVRDNWLPWHVAINLDGQLYIFRSRAEALAKLTCWRAETKGVVAEDLKAYGIRYRVRSLPLCKIAGKDRRNDRRKILVEDCPAF
jgi:hypothetical protein